MIIRNVLILVLVFGALFFDLRTYKIPNKLNICGCLAGLICSLVINGQQGLQYCLLGCLTVVAIMFLPFAIRAIGAGDVKLLCALSTFVYLDIIKIIAVSIILAALWGACLVAVRTVVGSKLAFTKIHFTIPISVSTLALLAFGI